MNKSKCCNGEGKGIDDVVDKIEQLRVRASCGYDISGGNRSTFMIDTKTEITEYVKSEKERCYKELEDRFSKTFRTPIDYVRLHNIIEEMKK